MQSMRAVIAVLELNGTRTNMPGRISPSTIEPANTKCGLPSIVNVFLTWNLGMTCESASRTELGDGGHQARRLEQRHDAAAAGG
jgi:hypothetical protein